MGRIIAVPLALLLTVIGTTGRAADEATGAEALLAADRAFGRASAERGLDGWMSCFAEDAAIFPPGRPIVSGLAAVRAYYTESGFTPAGLSWEPLSAELAASGDLGYSYGTWTFEGPGPDGQTRRSIGKYLTVWRKQADGSWKVVADIGNPDAPPKPE